MHSATNATDIRRFRFIVKFVPEIELRMIAKTISDVEIIVGDYNRPFALDYLFGRSVGRLNDGHILGYTVARTVVRAVSVSPSGAFVDNNRVV